MVLQQRAQKKPDRPHAPRTRRRRRDWVTGEKIALAEQVRMARIQYAFNMVSRQSTLDGVGYPGSLIITLREVVYCLKASIIASVVFPGLDFFVCFAAI